MTSGTVIVAKAAGIATPAVSLAILFDITVFGSSVFGVVGPVAIAAIAGVVTVRSTVGRIWRENYLAEKEKNAILEIDAKQQRELKHEALTGIAALRGQLELEKAKTDLTPIVYAMSEQRQLLEQIRDALSDPKGRP